MKIRFFYAITHLSHNQITPFVVNSLIAEVKNFYKLKQNERDSLRKAICYIDHVLHTNAINWKALIATLHTHNNDAIPCFFFSISLVVSMKHSIERDLINVWFIGDPLWCHEIPNLCWVISIRLRYSFYTSNETVGREYAVRIHPPDSSLSRIRSDRLWSMVPVLWCSLWHHQGCWTWYPKPWGYPSLQGHRLEDTSYPGQPMPGRYHLCGHPGSQRACSIWLWLSCSLAAYRTPWFWVRYALLVLASSGMSGWRDHWTGLWGCLPASLWCSPAQLLWRECLRSYAWCLHQSGSRSKTKLLLDGGWEMLTFDAPEPDAGLGLSLHLGVSQSEPHTAVYYRFGGLIDQCRDLLSTEF